MRGLKDHSIFLKSDFLLLSQTQEYHFENVKKLLRTYYESVM